MKYHDFFSILQKNVFFSFLILLSLASTSNVSARDSFNKAKDILIAQFDNKPDADDIHSQAALASILLHPDGAGVNYFAVMGAYGKQGGKYIDSSTLFNLGFGAKNVKWTDANKERQQSVQRIHDNVKPILLAGGKVWVQEAGQSDITLLWINALISSGVSASIIKSAVIVVQHSTWNENEASAGVLTQVKQKITYVKIDDGNGGGSTPDYNVSSQTFMTEMKSASNPNKAAQAIWLEADKIIKESGFNASYSPIPDGGVDFSDCVENWYILELGNNAGSVRSFWDRYVINKPTVLFVAIVDSNEGKFSKVAIYPNPVSNIFNIDIDGNLIEKIQLMDISGQIVYSNSKNIDTRIDISHLPSGIYFVLAHTNVGMHKIKIIKNTN